MNTEKYICDACGWLYDPLNADPEGCIPQGTAFDELPPDWTCPSCGVEKKMFTKENS